LGWEIEDVISACMVSVHRTTVRVQCFERLKLNRSLSELAQNKITVIKVSY